MPPPIPDARPMNTVVVSSSVTPLLDLIAPHVAGALGAQCRVLPVHEATPDLEPVCWLLLDAEAPRPARADTRLVDWSLLGASWLRERGTTGAHAALSSPDTLGTRLEILQALFDVPAGPPAVEFHASLRVADLSQSVRFYAWLLDIWPREWTHRYATFLRADLGLNFVLLVADGKALHHDTLYHLGLAVPDKAAVVTVYHRAVAFGARVVKPPRTTWRGTPLHELWLEDPDGTLVEVYARLSATELAAMPADQEPEFLVPGTRP